MLACRNSLGRAPKKRRTTAPRLRTFGNASDATSYDGHQKRLGGFGGWHDTRRGTYQVLFTDAPGTVPAVVGGGRSVFFDRHAVYASPRLFGFLCVPMAARISLLSPAICGKPDHTI